MTEFGPEYDKINTIWKRDERNVVIVGDWSCPEFAYLSDKDWAWTEKVDGTNIRLHGHAAGYDVRIGGRTDNAQLPAKLVDNLRAGGVLDLGKWDVISKKADAPVTIYGEGYGAKIQSGGMYRQDQWLVVFDVKVGDWWLRRDDAADVASQLGLEMVPIVGTFSPKVAWYRIATGELISAWEGARPEGLVGRPAVDLFNRKGERLLMKVKVKDWADHQRRGGAIVEDCKQ